jgi:hypothetical protein
LGFQFQSANTPLGLGSHVQTWRYQMPRRSAFLRAAERSGERTIFLPVDEVD